MGFDRDLAFLKTIDARLRLAYSGTIELMISSLRYSYNIITMSKKEIGIFTILAILITFLLDLFVSSCEKDILDGFCYNGWPLASRISSGIAGISDLRWNNFTINVLFWFLIFLGIYKFGEKIVNRRTLTPQPNAHGQRIFSIIKISISIVVITIILGYSGLFGSLNKPLNSIVAGTPDKSCNVAADCTYKFINCTNNSCKKDAVNVNWNTFCPLPSSKTASSPICLPGGNNKGLECVEGQCQRIMP